MTARISLFTALAFASPIAHAQDGGQLYATYCAACHGTQGEGALAGQFPPLAGSPWPVGVPDRAIKIVLNGLHGEIDVNGKTWNLEMPPQGAALPDDQVAAILTYVRTSWGNKAQPITPEQVKAIRAATASRSDAWTPAELQKLHPLEVAPPVEDLLSYVYDGVWQTLPDFSKLKAAAVEEEHKGLISLAKTGKKDGFGVVWEGTLQLPADADYQFQLAADDGGRFILDGRTVAEVVGIGPMEKRESVSQAIPFTKGPHKLRVEYFEFKGQEGIRVGWRRKGDMNWTWLSENAAPRRKWPEILLTPEKGKTVIFRNFIKDTTPRAIGVGFEGGANLAWSADHFAPELVWTGKFMDAGHHWTDRGIGEEPPAGENVVKLSDAVALATAAEARNGWPATPKTAPRFHGYQLDSAGNPTFATSVGDATLLDGFTPATGPAIVRTLSVKGKPKEPLAVLLAKGKNIKPAGNRGWELSNGLFLEVSQGTVFLKDNALILEPPLSAPVTVTYRWR
ncbi:MAG TPA: c-type cytochrome [Luteolibacter sp.]